MLSADTPASIVTVPYSTWFTTVTTGTSALGPGDSREISDDSVQKEDTNLEQNEAAQVAEVGGGVDLPKNDVCDALWAMLDAESDNEAEEMPEEWDLDSTLLNWGRNEPDMGPAGPEQGPPPAEF
ncbi:hypothetical protein PIB30_035412 [Stylosanthes scabra]|uniref:Uncharacterized protein n=1 Tax=Stylosanthes scabra TaxID=79078 RepID=A0ABU6QCJ7_9FABA|nr:hypothetical protein [Stylosanthes scabra]